MKNTSIDNEKGLTSLEVAALQKQYGKNIFQAETTHRLPHIIWDIVKEPMFVLLIIACSLYFILGKTNEGTMMAVAMLLVAAISLYQEVKSSNALQALQQFTQPKITVIREGKELVIATEELVPDDIILLEEGMNIPADAVVLQENDCTVNEAIITGESLPADKHQTKGSNTLYQGTTVNSGKCVAKVTAIGNHTVLGKLGKAIGGYHAPKTLLQIQINQFVRRLTLFGLIGFSIIFGVNFYHQQNWETSLLFALTLAMSAVPEEIPVAFSSFMALGAYKMSKLGIISRQPQIVENLGAVSVICFDKTGTLTENKMQVKSIYNYATNSLIELENNNTLPQNNVLHYGMLASETKPFDAMEKAIIEAYSLYGNPSMQHPWAMIHEYPLEGKPPMMTHVYEQDGAKIVAAKGAAERILQVCHLTKEDTIKITQHIKTLALQGYRVIGVASAKHIAPQFPVKQDDFAWQFEGLLALYDPPKQNVAQVIQQFYTAKIAVKLITGDYPETAMNIATQVGIVYAKVYKTGEQIMQMDVEELRQTVQATNVFARMFPDAKWKVIDALKANGEIVAMTGDGVNDGPALKWANIGIAMGHMGTEIARQASDLVLTDDNIERIITAIKEGRRIFSNLKKAIRYIISIHIPIIFIASMPVVLGWAYPNIFTPIHIIFMELIMGPTCSIFYEKEPVEKNIMEQSPRKSNSKIFTAKELFISIVQGLVIAAGTLALYFYYMKNGTSLQQVRTIVFTTLILTNILLTFSYRSFFSSIFLTAKYKNNLAPFILIVSASFLAALHFIPSIHNLFQLAVISTKQFGLCLGVSVGSILWFEIYKMIRRQKIKAIV